MTTTWPPATTSHADVADALPFLNRAVAGSPDVALNAEGGDVGAFGSAQLVARHVANYQAATEAVTALGAPAGPVLDVGCGVGALSAWAAGRLGRDLQLCDQDAAVVGFGAATFGVPAVTDLAAADTSPVVFAMEVLEHVAPPAQPGFLAAVWDRVAPGGLLVVSTPDETSYPGGWSGYAPHVGCVSPRELHDLLHGVTGQAPSVHRLDGGPYAMPLARRVLERVANTAWAALRRGAPSFADRVADLGSRGGHEVPADVAARVDTGYRVVTPRHGTGTGLLAVVRRPG